jgi:hypothetical protein
MKSLPYSKYDWRESHKCFDIINVMKF